jgi:5-methyltetrahydrofolate--homocysteine methyltransferase
VAGHPYLELIERRAVVFDGAMGTQIQALDLTAADFGGDRQLGNNDHLSLTRPDAIEGIHLAYLEAGADVVETNSFQASRIRMTEWGVGDHTREINLCAARIARRAADAYSTPSRPRFVAGSIGPSGMLPSSDDPALSGISFAGLSEAFCEQAAALVEGGADLLIIETQQDILETRAAIDGARAAFRELGRSVPLQVQVALDVTGRMLLGTDVGAVLAILYGMRADVIGVNCSVGPEHLREPVRYLCQHAPTPVSVIPNAGLPKNVDGVATYPLGPADMGRELGQFVSELGAPVVGGCCGSTPEHIVALCEAVSGAARAPRQVVFERSLASAITASALEQQPKPLLIGERVNTQGSRAFKQVMLADDYDGAVAIARDQVEGGAHALDVCVALTERADEADMMATLVKRLAMGVEMPLVFDSTDAAVVARALETYPGRALINSINMENGRERIDAVVPHAVRHGAACVALTIDEDGMAKTAERKLDVARRIHDMCVGEFGMDPGDLIFDTLTFTLATGQDEFRRSAVETIEGIRAVKTELPGVWTVLGVSNVSFGLDPAARAVINSVFLHHAIDAGLDAAIVNPTHVRPIYEISDVERELADDLIFDRRPDALERCIAHFEDADVVAAPQEDPFAGMTTDERLHAKILHRTKEGVEDDIDTALDERGGRDNDRAVDVLNNVLLPAMKDVGDRFGAGELILPFVLQSAEVMKRSVAHLEQYLDRLEGQAKATVVLATVFGDVHDIGKNLVGTILSNNGYKVVDLGRQVPLNVIMDSAVAERADAVGLSALLVSTSRQMPLALHELDHRGLRVPVLVGGAAINRAFGRRIAFLDDGRMYEPGVFYCKDAFEGLGVMDRLSDGELRGGVIAERRAEAVAERDTPKPAPAPEPAPARAGRDSLRRDVEVPEAPFLGARTLDAIDPAAVFALMDERSLYKLSWGGKGVRGEEWERLLADDFRPRRERMQAEAVSKGWIVPRAVYGFFRAVADGDDTVVLDEAGGELGRFEFPRQDRHDRLCISDYLREVGDRADVIALQIVTAGPEATAHVDALQAAGEYSEAYFAHGLAVEAAEGLAEYVHRRILGDLGLDVGRGRRYSWGYPACPDLEQHELVLQLLPPAADLGIELSAAYQFIPEQTTAAIVIHHPQAVYFSARRGIRSGSE